MPYLVWRHDVPWLRADETARSMKLDQWQEDVLGCWDNLVLRSGRQCGKTEIISRKAALLAMKYPDTTTLVIAPTERQASLLFERTLQHLLTICPRDIKKGRDKPTRHRVVLNNDSKILCLPTGLSGAGIRGHTVNWLIADEAPFIPEEVWIAVTPMLAATNGKQILLGTPRGKKGYFYECFSDDNFQKFHISAEDCPRINRDFLKKEKLRMTAVQYAQEYLGEFVDELTQFFPTELILKCMDGSFLRQPSFHPNAFPAFLGVDVAGMGSDETVLLTLRQVKSRLVQTGQEVTVHKRLTDTIERIKDLDSKNNYNRIYIDDGGIGVGVFDTLLKDPQTRKKVVAINNSARSIDSSGKNKKLLKEDLYNNLKLMMEQGRLELAKDSDTLLSLKSVQCEYDNGKLKLFGSYTHIAEALIRAAWGSRDKRLNIWIA